MSSEPANTGIALFDVVALTHDRPENGLLRGQGGTVVEVHANGEAFEVEFLQSQQEPIVATLPASALTKVWDASTRRYVLKPLTAA